MEEVTPKKRFSIYTVVVIFILVYITELALGAGLFLNIILPNIANYYQSKNTSNQISPNIISQQTTIYNMLKQNKLKEASESAQNLFAQAKTPKEKALANQVIGEVYAAEENYPQAKMFFNTALSLEPNLPGALAGLAGVNLVDKEFVSAISNAQKAINLDPKRTDYYFLLGLGYFGKGDKQKAIENVEKAIKTNPDVEEYKRALENIKQSNVSPQQPTATNKQPSQNSQAESNFNYSKANIDNFVNALNKADQDYQTLEKSYKGNSAYNQKTINRLLEIIPQRKVLAQKLLDKMGKGEKLTQSDMAEWDKYDVLSVEQDDLMRTLYNGNGGY